MKFKMTKQEIAKAKRAAKLRKNRRLPDGKFKQVMSQARSALCLDDDVVPVINTKGVSDDSYIVCSDGRIEKNRPVIAPTIDSMMLQYVIDGVRPVARVGKDTCSKPLTKKELELIKAARRSIPVNARTSNRRLSDKQYKEMMKKVKSELGINNNKTLPVFDSNTIESKKEETGGNRIIDLILRNLSFYTPRVYNEFETLCGGKKMQHKDKMAILSFLFHRDPKFLPMCLLPKNQRSNKIRKLVKTKGDVKVHPTRVIPSEEYLLEIQGKERSRHDAFDKLSQDKKVQWARYANQIIGFNGEDSYRLYRIRTEASYQAVVIAMKYACKMSKISEFRGNFANPYWILLRTNQFYWKMTSSERKVFDTLSLRYLDPHTNGSRVINSEKAVELVMPTLKKMGLHKQYLKEVSQKKLAYHGNIQKLGLIKSLLETAGTK